MALVLTPEILAAAYEYLRTTQPFVRWNLPEPDDVRFRVIRDRAVYGWHRREGKQHTIAISSAMIGHTTTLIGAMAHEMTHAHMSETGMNKSGDHGAAFLRLTSEICRVHGFDHKSF